MFWKIWQILQKHQKQPSSRKRCSENIRQIYKRTLMPKCDFNRVSCIFSEHLFLRTVLEGCFWNTPMFPSVFNKTAGGQAYNFIKRRLQHRCFSVKNLKFFKKKDFKEHLNIRISANGCFLPFRCKICIFQTWFYPNVFVSCFAWSFLLFLLQ